MSLTSLVSENFDISSGTFPFSIHRGHGSRPVRIVTSSTSRPSSAPAALPPRAAAPLGAASASGRWQWANAASLAPATPLAPLAPFAPSPKIAAVRVPPLLLADMGAAARASGRSLGDIWTEAAREWLRHHHAQEHEPQPPTPAAAALAIPRPTRTWTAIDAVLADLRQSPGTAA